MRRLLLIWLLLPFPILLSAQETATSAGAYKGLRIGLLNFEVLSQSPRSVTLRCDVANTGRYALEFDEKHPPPAALVVEMDTLSLPVVLRGREGSLRQAVLQEKIALSPGEMQRKLNLRISLTEIYLPPSDPPMRNADEPKPFAMSCGDLVFDTVFVQTKEGQRLVLHYVLQNIGPEPIRFYSSKERETIAIQVYFVRGERLTRGASLVASAFLTEREEFSGGILLPGQQLEGDLPVDLSLRTRFLPNLVLEINPFQAACETDMTNNTWPLRLDF